MCGPTVGDGADTGSLAVDFDTRADVELPTMVWALTVLRGMVGFMDGDDGALVTLTADWSGGEVLMELAPHRSRFLDRERDAVAWARAGDREFDVRCAVTDRPSTDAGPGTDVDGSAGEVIGRLLGRPGPRPEAVHTEAARAAPVARVRRGSPGVGWRSHASFRLPGSLVRCDAVTPGEGRRIAVRWCSRRRPRGRCR
ncbi:hypothetical protein [Kitasatospora sp. NPDC090091]|uniref:hypothetical protein n=1 Tax=Kitasatospora sp. NPDC090091 TaxID=3364081 RepID=UPI0037FC6E6D